MRDAVVTGRIAGSSGARVVTSMRMWRRALGGRGPFAWWVRLAAWNHVLTLMLIAVVAAGVMRWTQPPGGDAAWEASPAPDGPRTDVSPSDSDAGGPGAHFDTRRLFRVDAKPKPAAPVSSVTLAELSRPYSVRGIIGGDPPRAILFDNRTRETVYVTAGDSLGEIHVKAVRDDAVVLTWQNETLELTF